MPRDLIAELQAGPQEAGSPRNLLAEKGIKPTVSVPAVEEEGAKGETPLAERIVREAGRQAVATGEDILSLGTTAAVWPFAKAYGLMALPWGEETARTAEEEMMNLAYKPRTKLAQESLNMIGKAIETYLYPSRKAGTIGGRTGYALETAGEIAQFAMLPKIKAKAKATVTGKPEPFKPKAVTRTPSPGEVVETSEQVLRRRLGETKARLKEAAAERKAKPAERPLAEILKTERPRQPYSPELAEALKKGKVKKLPAGQGFIIKPKVELRKALEKPTKGKGWEAPKAPREPEVTYRLKQKGKPPIFFKAGEAEPWERPIPRDVLFRKFEKPKEEVKLSKVEAEAVKVEPIGKAHLDEFKGPITKLRTLTKRYPYVDIKVYGSTSKLKRPTPEEYAKRKTMFGVPEKMKVKPDLDLFVDDPKIGNLIDRIINEDINIAIALKREYPHARALNDILKASGDVAFFKSGDKYYIKQKDYPFQITKNTKRIEILSKEPVSAKSVLQKADKGFELTSPTEKAPRLAAEQQPAPAKEPWDGKTERREFYGIRDKVDRGVMTVEDARAGKKLPAETVSQPRLTANAADLAADYKARGIERQASYSQFVKDRALKPEMDAKEFFKIYDRVTPEVLADYPELTKEAGAQVPPEKPAKVPVKRGTRKVQPLQYQSFNGEQTLKAKSYIEYKGYKIVKEFDRAYNIVDSSNKTIGINAGMRGALDRIDILTKPKGPLDILKSEKGAVEKPVILESLGFQTMYEKAIKTIKRLKARKKHNEAAKKITNELSDAYEKQKDIWIGKKDVRLLGADVETRLLQKEIKKALGNKKYDKIARDYDKAIQIYVDTKRNPGHIKQYFKQLTPEQQRIVKLSQNLPPKIKKIANLIKRSYDLIGMEALDAQVIRNVLDNYTARVWDLEGRKAPTEVYRKFGTTTRHAKARKLETIIEGWAKGFELKIEGATSNLKTLKHEIIKTLEDKRFLNILKETTDVDGNPLISTKQLEGYVEVKHPNFNIIKPVGRAAKHVRGPHKGQYKTYGKYFFVDEKGTLWERQRLYAPEKQAKNLNNILGISKLKGVPGVDTITKYNAIAKACILQTSLFHHLAFTRSFEFGIRNKKWREINVRQSYKEGLEAIENLDPDIRTGVRNGLTLGLKQDWQEGLLREKTIFGKIFDKTDATKTVKDKITSLREAQADFLFGEFGAGLKAKAFLIEFRNALKEHPNENPDVIAKRIANLVNDDFGGLHLGRMGRNPTLQHIFRLVALAPDWTESNVRTMVKTIKAGSKAERQLYRKFWTSVIVKAGAATVLSNYLLAGGDIDKFIDNYKAAWEAGNLKWTGVDVTPIYKALGGKSGDRKYFALLGHFKDPIKFITHPVRSAHHKGSVVYGFFHEALAGTDWKGHKFTTMSELFKERKTVKWGPGGPISWEQLPSYIINEIIGTQPIQIQNFFAWYAGELEGFDAILNSLGIGITTAQKKKSKIKGQWPTLGSTKKKAAWPSL